MFIIIIIMYVFPLSLTEIQIRDLIWIKFFHA